MSPQENIAWVVTAAWLIIAFWIWTKIYTFLYRHNKRNWNNSDRVFVTLWGAVVALIFWPAVLIGAVLAKGITKIVPLLQRLEND